MIYAILRLESRCTRFGEWDIKESLCDIHDMKKFKEEMTLLE